MPAVNITSCNTHDHLETCCAISERSRRHEAQSVQNNIVSEEEVQDLKVKVLDLKKKLFLTTQQDLTQQPPLYFRESLI